MVLGAAQFRAGQAEAARASFAAAISADDRRALERSPAIVRRQAQAGDLVGALRSVASIPEASYRDRARAWVATDLAREGKPGDALEIVGAIEHAAIRATALAHVGAALLKAGDPDRALDAFRRAAAAAEATPPEAARIVSRAWAAAPRGAPEALAWARRRPAGLARAAALLGVAEGVGGYPAYFPVPGFGSPYYIPE
jgi:hypothetical protein